MQPETCESIFEKVQLGMTVQQVNAVLGREGQEHKPRGSVIGYLGWATWHWKDSTGNNIYVMVILDRRKVMARHVTVQGSDGPTTSSEDR